MNHDRQLPMDGAHASGWLWLLAVGAWIGLLLYRAAAARLTCRGDRWPRIRSSCAAAGATSLAAGAVLPYATPSHSFVVAVAQHLLMVMVAPAFLAGAAPVTLALRACAPRHRRRLLRVVRSRYAGLMTGAPLVLLLDVGGLYAFYLTPLYGWAHHRPAAALMLHLHMVIAGYLISSYLVGIDPMPHRDRVSGRLMVLLAASAAHDVLAKLMVAHALPTGVGDVRAGAELMYYGGTAVEFGLALSLLSQWYRAGSRDLDRRRRRAAESAIAAGQPTAPVNAGG